jgi:DNA-binding SARP family transcriptional activator
VIRDPAAQQTRDVGADIPPVRLDVLGRVGLLVDGQPGQAVLVQPKRLALLVWIALRRPGGFVRRDELLGVFWPASTESRARASLRQALQFLRRNLGQRVVINRGDGEIGVDPAIVACDAIAFLDAVDRGEDDVALQRYGGDLLPGFILDGAHEFDRWLQSERQRLRAAAIAAALSAADLAETARDDARAADRVAWALRLEPTDEAVARRLMTLLARGGNRAAAIATYDELAGRLRTEFDLEPSPQTVELADSLRAEDASSMHAARADDVGTAGTRTLSAQRVLVLELENRTGDDSFDLLGGLAAETLAQGLAGVPDLEVVPPLAVGPLPPADAIGADAASTDVAASAVERSGLPPAMAALAKRTGAGTLITGSVHRDAGGLLFQVRVTDVAGGRLLRGPDPVRADEATPLDGIERLRESVLTAVAPALTQRVVHVREATRPPGMDAYRAYLDGLERFVHGEWPAALEYFRRAGTLAPDYALPRIVSAIALWNMGELRSARAAAGEADALRVSLGRFERAVLDMVLAWLSGDWAAAYRAAAVQAGMAPGSIPHFQVAEEARRLNRPREARDLLGRLNPEAGELRGWIFYWVELASAHHMLRDHARELEVASRCRRLHPDEPTAALLEVRAFAGLGREHDVLRVVDQLLASPAGRRPSPGALMVEAALELQAHAGAGSTDGTSAAATAAALLDRAVEWYRADAVAGSDDDAADGADDSAAHRRELGRALVHAGRIDEARAIFEQLARSSAGRVQPIDAHHPQLQAHLDEGMLGVITARQGDTAALARWIALLEGLDGPFLYGAHWYWLAAIAAVRGDADRAIRMLRRAFADGLPMELFIHADPHLGRLRGDERFDALMRPRG